MQHLREALLPIVLPNRDKSAFYELIGISQTCVMI
jgi:hypothetical protein